MMMILFLQNIETHFDQHLFHDTIFKVKILILLVFLLKRTTLSGNHVRHQLTVESSFNNQR